MLGASEPWQGCALCLKGLFEFGVHEVAERREFGVARSKVLREKFFDVGREI
jgi:hypothetical protein